MGVKAFIPGKVYPAISITGNYCMLNCKYCEKHYLEGMIHATTPTQLYHVAKNLYRHGARGLLLSGGFTSEGFIPIKPFLNVIKDIKKDFGLIISVHSGLVDKGLASKIRESGVDIVDYQLIIDPIVIKDIQGLNKNPEDYIKSLEYLKKYGPPNIVPHIPLGLKHGLLSKEKEAIEILKDHSGELAVFLIFTPTKNTSMEAFKPPEETTLLDLFNYAQNLKREIALGCMRPFSFKQNFDEVLIKDNLISRIAVPLKNVIKKYNMKVVNACCSIPKEYFAMFGN
ncbi:MAG: radical SAM protein [Nitrososphaeria archaeon]